MRTLLALTCVTALATVGAAQGAMDEPRAWTAHWIAVPDAPPTGFGVYHFRRAFDLESVPSSFVVHVSADNRYQLFANGRRVSWGPARGDLMHWHYETVDLAPFLVSGRNVLAALVWSFGDLAPLAQVTLRTGFLLQGHSEVERVTDSGTGWRCSKDEAYTPIPTSHSDVGGYYVVGPGEHVRATDYPWGWEKPDFDDTAWPQAASIADTAGWDSPDSHSAWFLKPRTVPPMEERTERIPRLRRAEGVEAPAGFPGTPGTPWTVPAHSHAEVLLDRGHLTTGYPELLVSGGRDATVTIAYAETLWLPNGRDKGNRDEIEGKVFRGNHDVFVPDGGRQRLFRPLWWRTFRYLQLTIATADQPLTLEDLRSTFTAYPFERRARFESDDAELDHILDVGWRTARLCAHETYMDCPYWEQLQYAGDTRIQALVSLYMAGDDRLMRQAIQALDASRVGEAPTTSRYPSRLPQYIPPFSLWWIGMVHDFWWYRDDPRLVRSVLPGVRSVLAFFERHQLDDGHVGRLPWWSYVDWTDDWPSGVPPGWNTPPRYATESRIFATRVPRDDPRGSSAVIDLQLLLAYDWAADMENALGLPALSDEYRARARRLRTAVRESYWDDARHLFADTGQHRRFSQQANALAILAGVVDGDGARVLAQRLQADDSLTRASLYFRTYLHSALAKAGLGDRYLDLLEPWRRMLALGVTTWPETEDPSRSECHAWGASPNVEIFRTVLGIDSAAPGFARVRVRPSFGSLRRLRGTVPHPRGELVVTLQRADDDGLSGELVLPQGVTGVLEWHGSSQPLHEGTNAVEVRPR